MKKIPRRATNLYEQIPLPIHLAAVALLVLPVLVLIWLARLLIP